MQNVEFKAELRDFDAARGIVRLLGATWIARLDQTDTYYRVTSGRLKRRECAGEPVEYIFYERTNRLRPKLSHFQIYSEPQFRERFGVEPMPVWLTIKKRRELFMTGNVRIHLDRVEDLGAFLELEALVSREYNVAACHRAIQALVARLRPVLGEPLACGYSDLMAQSMELPAQPFIM